MWYAHTRASTYRKCLTSSDYFPSAGRLLSSAGQLNRANGVTLNNSTCVRKVKTPSEGNLLLLVPRKVFKEVSNLLLWEKKSFWSLMAKTPHIAAEYSNDDVSAFRPSFNGNTSSGRLKRVWSYNPLPFTAQFSFSFWYYPLGAPGTFIMSFFFEFLEQLSLVNIVTRRSLFNTTRVRYIKHLSSS